MELIATCAFGLESIVVRELKALGYEAKTTTPGRVLFHGEAAAIARANLWLRTSDRILVRLAHFKATDFGELFDVTRAVPWHEWITPDGQFPVSGRSHKSQLSSVPACQRIVKKAIVESLRAGHSVEALEETGPITKIEIALLNDEATITLDTTGPSLHKRGYRKLAAKAPIKETLAAAMIQLSYWRRDRPLIDPFCGSGTIPIEAALIGRNLAPGLHRDFSAEAWHCVPESVWKEARDEAWDLALPALEVRVLGTDMDAEVLSLARYHAQQAGVSEDVHFQQRSFEDLQSKQKYGCVIANPPYGVRLYEQREVEPLYRSMPMILRRLPTWSHYILTPHPTFEQLLEKQADRRRKLYNGRIQCTYYQYHGPKPSPRKHPAAEQSPSEQDIVAEPVEQEWVETEPIETESIETESIETGDAADVVSVVGTPPPEEATPLEAPTPPSRPKRPEPVAAFGGVGDKGRQQAELFGNRLAKRARHLRRWPTRRGITCYRLYERDVAEVPLVVDRYEDHLHITEYERPHERTASQNADWLELMARTAAKVLEVERKNVFVKSRARQRGETQYERFARDQYELTVNEGGLQFLTNLSDYVDTGLFLDHRVTRGLVRDEAAGKHFLNLFAYTGSFSVYAADGGALTTTTVDLSNTYLDWAERNMQLNGREGEAHRFVHSDVVEFLQRSNPNRYDLAVVDPPTFSNSKRTDEDWQVQDEHVALLGQLFPLMSPGGVIYFSNNFRRFKLDEAALTADGVTIREISRKTVPEDFRNQRIHRCWRMVLPE